MQPTRALKMCEGKTNATDPRDLFPRADALRQCGNPECRKWFRPVDKYHPYQRYCGCAGCTRSRGAQREWKHEHPELYRKIHAARATAASMASGSAAGDAVLNCRLLWLLAGIVSKALGIKDAGGMTTAMEGLVASGRRACGRTGGLSILTSLLFAGT